LEYEAVSLGHLFPTFRNNILPLYARDLRYEKNGILFEKSGTDYSAMKSNNPAGTLNYPCENIKM
jgi:hypothetical protein